MATKIPKAGKLVLTYETGFDAERNPIYKAKSYKGLAADVTPDQVEAVGMAIASLQQHTLSTIAQDVTYQIEA
ncbi:MAG: DUF1659 domain-containing protein [Bacillaceae bacterium]